MLLVVKLIGVNKGRRVTLKYYYNSSVVKSWYCFPRGVEELPKLIKGGDMGCVPFKNKSLMRTPLQVNLCSRV